jgi:hypothetical protein
MSRQSNEEMSLQQAFSEQLLELHNELMSIAEYEKIDCTPERLNRIGNWSRIDALHRREEGWEFIHDEDEEENWDCPFDKEGTRTQQIKEWEEASYIEHLISLGVNLLSRHYLGMGSAREELFIYRIATIKLGYYFSGGYDQKIRNEVSKKNDDAIQKIKDDTIQEYCEEIKRKASERATAIANMKHQKDPRRAEKTFILDCWNDWNAGKSIYKNQTAFAKDMLTKVVHLESQKVIETWCTEWNKRKSA